MIERIFNAETGEITERPYTDQELAAAQAAAAEIEARLEAEQIAIRNRETVLAALAAAAGLEVDEVKAALGA